jgi:acetyl-CoA carboxylase biotin carboxyl carrier protein
LDFGKLRELIEIFQSSELFEMEIEEAGQRIRLSKAAPSPAIQPAVYAALPSVVPAPSGAAPAAPAPNESPAIHTETEDVDEGIVTIDSPMVGVFYASPAPGEPPFVKVGDIIDENQTVCIVEAMKLMNEVTAKFRCELVNVLVENGEPVEYNQPMFAVRPAG